jgi:dipeptidyl aminopeptidase/acylaminoacyl peptidase
VVHPHLDVIAPDGASAWSAPLPEAFRYPWGQGARPAWSPDGRLIAITGFEDVGPVSAYPSTVWIVDTVAQSVRELTAGSAPTFEYIPTWTRDGQLLVSRLTSGIWELDPSTGAATPVYSIPSPGPCDAESCAGNLITTVEPSPDGSRLAMVVLGEGVVVLDLATGEARQPRLPDGFGGDVPIRWTADGAALVIRIGKVSGEPFFATEVGRLDLATGDLTILASDVYLFDLWAT